MLNFWNQSRQHAIDASEAAFQISGDEQGILEQTIMNEITTTILFLSIT